MSRNNDQWYIERTDDGDYSAKKGGAQRSSAMKALRETP
jgi:hypothetical protein